MLKCDVLCSKNVWNYFPLKETIVKDGISVVPALMRIAWREWDKLSPFSGLVADESSVSTEYCQNGKLC